MSDEGIIVPPGGKPMPTNELTIGGGASTETGAEIHGSFERDLHTTHGDLSAGVEGGISQKQGWSVGGFFKWMFK
jgi:hypothetical protein